jgi:hypothetical protein
MHRLEDSRRRICKRKPLPLNSWPPSMAPITKSRMDDGWLLCAIDSRRPLPCVHIADSERSAT